MRTIEDIEVAVQAAIADGKTMTVSVPSLKSAVAQLLEKKNEILSFGDLGPGGICLHCITHGGIEFSLVFVNNPPVSNA